MDYCNLSVKEYLNDPCGTSSIPFWKLSNIKLPQNIKVLHKNNLNTIDITNYTYEKYFRLSHNLERIPPVILHENYEFAYVNINTELQLVADVISHCYDDIQVTKDQVYGWTKEPTFDENLWLFVIDKCSKSPVALGIADFDMNIKEGSLEWIQVLPKFRRQGLGKAIVNKLLLKLSSKANFVTVSGQIDNISNPESLYRKCGFEGNDIWYVLKMK